MAILDFLKNKEDAKKAEERKKAAVKKSASRVSAAKKQEVKTEKTAEVAVPKKTEQPRQNKKNGKSFDYEAINRPHISEKATLLAESNQYTFEIPSGYNKTEVKKAIEGIYNVDVLSVNMITIPAKKRRLGKTQGWRKKLTKAVVKIREGQKIEIL